MIQRYLIFNIMKKFSVYNLFLFVLFYNDFGNCANILGVFPGPGYSQYMLAEPLMVALAEKGHNVTVISGFNTKGVNNFRSITIDMVKDDNIHPEMLFKLQELDMFLTIAVVQQACFRWTHDLLSNDKVQEFINSGETFDLVIVEAVFSEALQVFAKHFNAHQVLFSAIAASDWNTNLVGVPNLPSYLPGPLTGYSTHMSFFQRFKNTIALWYSKYYNQWYIYPAHQKLVDKYFPNKYILDDFIYNASVMLTCSHVSTTQTIPLPTSVVEVGGLHIKSNKLPEHIQAFLDSAEDGAIFFSMGSHVQSSAMPKKTIDEILDVIKNLKQKVLWKFESENLENKPDNLLISKWFPQSDILAHPNTVAFVSHCGTGSITETVHHGIPIIGIPIFADHFMNMRKMIEYGMAIELPFKEISAQTFNDSIQTILYEKRYRENAKRRSNIMKDRPVKPLDEAVYWVEYVLRHDGAHHLKSSILALSWFQLYIVDILLVFLIGLIVLVYSIYRLFGWLWPRKERKSKTQ